MSSLGFDYDFVDLAVTEPVIQPVTTPGPSFGQTKLVEAMDLLIFSFDEFSCRYNGGFVYEWHEESSMTFKRKGTVRQYIGELCGSTVYREVMTNQLNAIVLFLQNNPDYKGMHSLKIDLNLIEVCKLYYDFTLVRVKLFIFISCLLVL